MDIKTLVDNIQHEVCCFVCKRTFTDAKQLPCLHSFCLHCLNGIQRTGGVRGKITCPKCKRQFQISGSGNPSELPSLDVLAIIKCKTANVKCGNCYQRSAQTLYCFQCCSFWCEECILGHNIIRTSKEHRTLALKDFQDQDIEALLKRPEFCQMKHHENKKLEFFCKDCKVAVCHTCVVTLHEGHGKMLSECIPRISFTKSEKLINVLNSEGIGKVKTVFSETEAQKSGAEGKESSKLIAENKGANVRDSPLEAQVQTRRFRSVLSFGQKGESVGMLNWPCGLAVNDQDEIAVTELWNHRVSVFSSKGSHLRSFGREGLHYGELKLPSGIAFDSLGNILVADCGNHRVQVFDSNGNFQSKFGEEGGLDHQLSCPEGLSINDDGDIIVADKGNKLIKIFSSRGEYLRKFGGAGALDNPYHCIQHREYLIVSDWGDNSIKMFDLEGNFIFKFGKPGDKDGEFNRPFYLSVNKEGLLMVCDSNNHRVQVFELSGNFVTKFRSEGSEREDFKRPMSTANLSNGRIVVCNSDNDQIQVFEQI